MKCKEIRKLLEQRIDNLISAGESALLAEHLENCTSCRQENERWLNYKKLLAEKFQEVSVPELSPQFSENFYRRLEKEAPTPVFEVLKEKIFSLLPIPAPLSWAGAVVVLIFLAVFGIRTYFNLYSPKDVALQLQSNREVLMEVAIKQSNEIEEHNLVEAQSKELLENFL